MAHGDDRGVVAWRSMNDKREALIGTGMIESGAYSYPKKSVRMPDPINLHGDEAARRENHISCTELQCEEIDRRLYCLRTHPGSYRNQIIHNYAALRATCDDQ